MTCTASGTAVAGQYANIGTAKGTPAAGPEVAASNPSHYFGLAAGISLEKNGTKQGELTFLEAR